MRIDWDVRPRVGQLQESSRKNRYQLIAKECYKQGITHILTAHHADDQVETFFMRMFRQSGLDGLTGMHASRSFIPELCQLPLHNYELRIHRPLLGVNKESLRGVCEKFDNQWIEDPSNKNMSFIRNDTRRILAQFPTESTTAVPHIMASIHQNQEMLNHMLFAAAKSFLTLNQKEGCVEINIQHSEFTQLAHGLRLRLFRQVLWLVSGLHYPPGSQQVERIVKRLEQAVVSCPIEQSRSYVPEMAEFEQQYADLYLQQQNEPTIPISALANSSQAPAPFALFEQQYLTEFEPLNRDHLSSRSQVTPSKKEDKKIHMTVGRCLLELSDDSLIIARQPMPSSQLQIAKLQLNQAVWWDGRFIVSVQGRDEDIHSNTFIVRPLSSKDVSFIGLHRSKTKWLLNKVGVWPVIECASTKKLVSVPHLKREFRQDIQCSVKWHSRYALDNSMDDFHSMPEMLMDC